MAPTPPRGPLSVTTANWSLPCGTRSFSRALPCWKKERPYPHGRLLKNWKLLLTNQFHDIIPGSSIGRVYDDLGCEREVPVSFQADLVKEAATLKVRGDNSKTVYPVQCYTNLDGKETAVSCPRLPPLGWITLSPAEFTASPCFTFRGNSLKTPFYEVGFYEAGIITSLFDIRGNRELVALGGVLNGFVSAQDVPVLWEA